MGIRISVWSGSTNGFLAARGLNESEVPIPIFSCRVLVHIWRTQLNVARIGGALSSCSFGSEWHLPLGHRVTIPSGRKLG